MPRRGARILACRVAISGDTGILKTQPRGRRGLAAAGDLSSRSGGFLFRIQPAVRTVRVFISMRAGIAVQGLAVGTRDLDPSTRAAQRAFGEDQPDRHDQHGDGDRCDCEKNESHVCGLELLGAAGEERGLLSTPLSGRLKSCATTGNDQGVLQTPGWLWW